MSITDKSKFSWRWEASHPPDRKRSSSTMPCCVIPFWKFFACQYFWKPCGLSKLNFFSSEKTTFRHSLALMVWYRRAYSSRFSLCFIVNLGRWILFLCLIFSLFKCLLIVLVLRGVSTRDFNIFDVDEVFFFTSRTILLLNCGDQFSYSILIWIFQIIADNVLCPLRFFSEISRLFSEL